MQVYTNGLNIIIMENQGPWYSSLGVSRQIEM